jgi:DNA-binding MarR family transcriptional regulator
VRLEEEIKQEKFKSEHHKLMINLLFTSSWLHRLQLSVLRPYDLTPPQYNILRILRGAKGELLSLGEITNRMIDRSSNTSRLIDKLVVKKWVSRKTCSNDRRQSEIGITKDGLQVLGQLDGPIDSITEQFLFLSVKETKEVNQFLDQLRNQNLNQTI